MPPIMSGATAMHPTLVLENARCFREARAPIAPLTLLVGENSTGKSSFLAFLRLAWDLTAGRVDLDFNEEPFRLGAYDQIAHYHGGQGKRAPSFALGLERPLRPGRPGVVSVLGRFGAHGGQPNLLSIDASVPRTKGRVDFESGARSGAVHVPGEPLDAWPFRFEGAGDWLRALKGLAYWTGERTATATDSGAARRLARELGPPWSVRPFASAPIRTAPKRTYDPVRETPTAAGDHVPMLLARLASGDAETWGRIADAIVRFGGACGLLDGIEVYRPRRKDSEPFQIHVEIQGQKRSVNLIDVGYGVSQVLPLLVDSLTTPAETMLLLQQPEVHLHPRAQAEVGSFLGSLVATGRSFVVETHSDHLIDRICTDVRDGRGVKRDDVVVLYFERKGATVEVHPLRVDEQGTLIGAPPGYREFFRREQLRHLGIEAG